MSDEETYEEIAERYRIARAHAYAEAKKQLAEEFEQRGLRDAAAQVRKPKKEPRRRWWEKR